MGSVWVIAICGTIHYYLFQLDCKLVNSPKTTVGGFSGKGHIISDHTVKVLKQRQNMKKNKNEPK